MTISRRLQRSLSRLASSNFKMQGVGKCQDASDALALFHLGLARPVIGEDDPQICAVTLHGFRYLESQRVKRSARRVTK
jgi:hypothetical protein